MPSPPEPTSLVCRSCGNRFEASWGPSVDRDRDDFDGGYVDEITSVTCPACGTTVEVSALIEEGAGQPFVRE